MMLWTGTCDNQSPLFILQQLGSGQDRRDILKRIALSAARMEVTESEDHYGFVSLPDPSWRAIQVKTSSGKTVWKFFGSDELGKVRLGRGGTRLFLAAISKKDNKLLGQGQLLPDSFGGAQMNEPVIAMIARAPNGSLSAVVVDRNPTESNGKVCPISGKLFEPELFQRDEKNYLVPKGGVCRADEIEKIFRRGMQVAREHFEMPQEREKNNENDIDDDHLRVEKTSLVNAGWNELEPGESMIAQAQKREIEAKEALIKLQEAEIKKLTKNLKGKTNTTAATAIKLDANSIGTIVQAITEPLLSEINELKEEIQTLHYGLRSLQQPTPTFRMSMPPMAFPASPNMWPTPPMHQEAAEDRPEKKAKKSKKEEKKRKTPSDHVQGCRCHKCK